MKVVLAHGPAGLFDFFPLLFIGAGVWVILMVLRDGQKRSRGTGTASLPRTPWSRQVHAATRKRGGEKPTVQPAERPAVRFGPSKTRLRVMEGGEGADGNRPTVPRRFEPPPPGRRTG